MSTYVFAFLIGVIAGLRSLTAPAAVSWAARLGWLHLENTWMAFLGFAEDLMIPGEEDGLVHAAPEIARVSVRGHDDLGELVPLLADEGLALQDRGALGQLARLAAGHALDAREELENAALMVIGATGWFAESGVAPGAPGRPRHRADG